MGIVYDAVDETLQRRVAIKQLSRDGGATSDDLDRFLKEARLVASLKHPHLAEIYNVINEADLYLVFEYVDGEALDKVLSRNGRIPLPQARRLLSEVAAALDYAHGRKIIHRDLKPSNIMITKEGSAKVMDFGIAHQSQSGKGLTMTAASGTPPYMAPEQALGSVSRSSDLYALGVMAYEMVTGERPFPGPDYLEQKLQKRFLPPSQRNRDLRREFDAFFSRALEPDPTRRPEDAKMFLRGFEDVCTAAGRIS
ncbi:MAG: serine/threonine protein kinase [Elusimicrobia bacterium]|nr:serine/threonine protein kinase [Elusimicrobiota bacterium]